MSTVGGEWGNARWQGSLWGYGQAGILLSGLVMSQALRNLLNQNPPRELRMRPVVLLDGVDITPVVENVNVQCASGNSSSLCQMTIIGNELSGLVLGTSQVEVKITIQTPEGDSVTGPLFRGIPRSIVPAAGSQRRSLSVQCFDEAYGKLQAEPESTVSNGLIADYLNTELISAGIERSILKFEKLQALTNYYIQHSSLFQMLKDLAGSSEPVLTYYSARQILTVKSYFDLVPNGWRIPLSAQTQQSFIDSARSRYNRVLVKDANGFYQVYEDLADQALHGVMSKTLEPNVGLLPEEALLRAEREAKVSMMRGLRWETPMNAFIQVGDCVEVQLLDESYATVIVESVTHQLGWPTGFWSSWEGKMAA